MYSKILSASVYGIDGRMIEVEVDIANGLPQVNVVGLPDPAIRESVERVRAAIKNCGYQFPLERITVNLAPADQRKEGTAFDLAIAIGVLAASAQLDSRSFERTLIIGELALSGDIRPVPGILPMALQAKQAGFRRVLLPLDNVAEATLVGELQLTGLTHLKQLKEPLSITRQHARLDSDATTAIQASSTDATLDYSEVIGQQHAKRALLTAAAGRHNLLLCGPPGTGKTMLIRRLPTILPPLEDQEALEVTKIYSVTGKFASSPAALIRERPFRAPHHTISPGGLIGGGSIPRPGEVTLAHHGILFLDELPEFSRTALEVLRQPLEDRHVTIARTRTVLQYPAQVMLAASMNPCGCGYYGDETNDHRCSCSAAKLAAYRAKISGPLLDRIDLQVEVPRPDRYSQSSQGWSSAQMLQLVMAARERQLARSRQSGVQWNSELGGTALRHIGNLKSDAERLLQQAYQSLGLSMRAHDRIVKLARTIADLGDKETIEEEHVAEAIQYRCLDRKLQML